MSHCLEQPQGSEQEHRCVRALSSAGAQRRFAILAPAVLLGVGILFFPVRDAGLVWDDHVLLSGERFENLASLLSPYLPTQEGTLPPYFRPVATLTFAIEYSLFRLEPAGFHLFNLVLHLANTLLVMRLAQRFWPDVPAVPLLSGLIFGVHPVHVEVVAWIAGRPDLLATLLTLLAVERYTRGSSEARGQRIGTTAFFSGVLWLMGLLAKESAVSLPLWLLSVSKRWHTRRSALLVGVTFLMAGLLYGVMRFNALHVQHVRDFPDSPWAVKLPMAGVIVLAYLRRFLVPEAPCAHWELSHTARDALWGLSGLGIVLGLLFWMGWLFRSKNAPYSVLEGPDCAQRIRQDSAEISHREGGRVGSPGHVGFLWMVLFLLPVLGLIPIDETVAERYLYLPSVGLSWWMASLICTRSGSTKHSHSGTHLRASILGAMQWLLFVGWIGYGIHHTRAGIQHWQSDRMLMDHEVQCAPESGQAHMKRGEILRSEGLLRQAEDELKRAIVLNPRLPHAHTLLAALALDQGDPADALLHLGRALALRPPTVAQRLLLARTLLALDRNSEAQQQLREASVLAPADPELLHTLGMVALRLGEPAEAVSALSRLIELGGGDADVYTNRGIAHMMLGARSLGLDDFQMAARLGDDSPRLACNVGRALLETGDWVGGCAALTRCSAYGQAPEQVKMLLAERCSRTHAGPQGAAGPRP